MRRGEWVAIVLAAGRGTRMGGPKALMSVRGRAWWRVQEERLERAGVERVWVVSREVEAVMAGEEGAPGRRVIGDSAAPMFASVLAGVGEARGAGVFVLPVDVPAPGGAVFGALAAGAGDGVAVPVFQGKRGHPAALSARWVGARLASALPDQRLDALIAEDVVEVEVQDSVVLVNLNTPAEVRAWEHGSAGDG